MPFAASDAAAMSVLPGPIVRSRWSQAWRVVLDLLIVIAVIWTIPLLVGALGAIVRVVVGMVR